MNRFQMYVLTKLDELKAALFNLQTTTMVLSLFAIGLAGMARIGAGPEPTPGHLMALVAPLMNFFYVVFPIMIAAFGANLLIPSMKQAAVIIVVPPVINNKQVQKVPRKFLDLADDWIRELSPSKRRKR